MNLFNLSDQYMQAFKALEQMDDMPEQAIKDTLEGLEGEFKDKVISLAMFAVNLQKESDAIKELTMSMTFRAGRKEWKSNDIKSYIKRAMDLFGLEKIESPYFNIKILSNPKKVEIVDESLIPKGLFIPIEIEEKLDKKAVKKLIESGQEVPGCKLVQDTRLEIK